MRSVQNEIMILFCADSRHTLFYFFFVAVFLGYNQYWPGDFLVLYFLCPGTPKGSTGSDSGFKASQKTGQGLKSHLTDWEKPGIKPATPGYKT